MNGQDTAIYPSLRERRVFVTGGATGIGAAMVSDFAAQGARVAFVDIAKSEGTALGEHLAAQGGEVVFIPLDVTDIDALKTAIADIEERWGGLDVLVNNVANDARHDWRDVNTETWNRTLNVNLRPMFFAIQAVLPGMLSRGYGSIINFGSISWKVKHGGMPAYTTAKAAVHGLTRSFVNELGESGVRINTVVPGWVLTDRQRQLHFGPDGEETLRQNQPMKGIITPGHAASLVLFLGADDSVMCTGQEFTIDGGWA